VDFSPGGFRSAIGTAASHSITLFSADLSFGRTNPEYKPAMIAFSFRKQGIPARTGYTANVSEPKQKVSPVVKDFLNLGHW
jgi:hypothetical protein